MDDTQKKILALGILGIGAYIFYAKKASAAELPEPAPALPAPQAEVTPVAPAPPKPRPRGSGGTKISDVKTLQQRLNWLHDAVASEGIDATKAGVLSIDLSKGGVGQFGPQTQAALNGAWKLVSEVFRIRPGTALTADHVFFTAVAADIGGADKMKDIKNLNAFANAITKYKSQMSTADRKAIKDAASGFVYQGAEDASVPGYASAKDGGRVNQQTASPEVEEFQRRLNGLYDAILSVGGVSAAQMNAAGVYKVDFSKGGVGMFGPQTRRARDGMLRLIQEAMRRNPVSNSSFTSYMADVNSNNFMSLLNKISLSNMKSSDKQILASAVKNLGMAPPLVERFV